MDIREELIKTLNQTHTAPFLFIGSGFTRRYLGLPTYFELLREASKYISGKKYYFKSLSSKARQHVEGKENLIAPEIAQLMKDEIDYHFYEHERYHPLIEKHPEIFGEAADDNISAFKWIIKKIIEEKTQLTKNEKYLEEIELLKPLNKKGIHGIITTNYDLFLESIFKDFTVYKGQKELLTANIDNFGEIFKIHGCLTEFNDMIITTKDYEVFRQKYAYLTAKLLTIFVEHPVIFLGYSVRDANITEILNSITECIGYEKAIEKFEDKLIFIEWDKDIQEPEMTMDRVPITDSKYIKMKNFKVKDYNEIFQTLGGIKNHYSISFLKKLKNDLYKMANNTNLDTLEKVKILPDEFDEEETEFVMGIALEERIKYFNPELVEVFEDILFDNKNLPPNIMVEKALPKLLKKYGPNCPAYKYLKHYDKSLPKPFSILRTKYSDFTSDAMKQKNQHLIEKYQDYTVSDFFKTEFEKPSDLVKFPYIKGKNIDPEELRDWLIWLYETKGNLIIETSYTSAYRKMIMIYDFLKYKK